MRQAALVFRDSLGLFWFDRYKSLAGALLNLGISIVLARQFGTVGVFGGTLISTLLTSFWVEPWILYRHSLKISAASYFMRYGFYTAVVTAAGFVTNLLCLRVGGGIGRILGVRLLICITIPNLIFLLCYFRTREFRFLWKKFMDLTEKWRGKS